VATEGDDHLLTLPGDSFRRSPLSFGRDSRFDGHPCARRNNGLSGRDDAAFLGDEVQDCVAIW
jgi:hypothetical protein